MSESNGQHLDPEEVACLSPDDPRRAGFLATLNTSAEREIWEREWGASDRIRFLLQQVDLPSGLHDRLKRIPENDAAAPAAGAIRASGLRIRWQSVAAILLVVGLVAGAYWWYDRDTRPLPMDRAISQQIAAWAVKQSAEPLTISSSDAEAVRQKLASYGYDFPVLMLTPSADVTLQGGGVAVLGSAKAVFTKWAGEGYSLTLYEFNGKDVSAPARFQTQSEVPLELWHEDMHYRVLIFPGQAGKCCWALVMDTEQSQNVFSQYTAGSY